MRAKLLNQIWLVFCLVLLSGITSFAQNYNFSVPKEVVDVFIDPDCSIVIQYQFTFANSFMGDAIDVVDVGFPSNDYDLNSCVAYIGKEQLTDIRKSEYIDIGIEVHLNGNQLITPGETDTLTVMGRNYNMVYADSGDSNYASMVFSPTWFGSDFATGSTEMTVNIHFPPGLKQEEPRYHQSETMPAPTSMGYLDDRVVYTWYNSNANPYTQYFFGVSFPRVYVTGPIKSPPSGLEKFITGFLKFILGFLPCLIPFMIVGLIIILAVASGRSRKLQYLPAKASIEGVGIKRGLTAPEAGLLLEMPLNKVLTMILFGLLKKRVLSVETEEPLTLKKLTPPAGLKLNIYEQEFVASINEKGKFAEDKLRTMFINMIKDVNTRMKGFSRKETTEYYQTIVNKAWEAVKSAETPELTMARWEENVEWTMMDKDFEDHTRTIFVGRTIYAPTWWPSGHAGGGGGGGKGGGGGSVSVPTLPGATFASGVIGKMQSFSSHLVSNLTGFTSGVTASTNPVPVSTYSGGSGGGGGGGGGGCACACACAGCACACAGGGR